MRYIVAALLALAFGMLPFNANASGEDQQYILSDGGGHIILSNKACTDPAILQHIKPEYRADFDAGEVSVPGKPTLSFCFDRAELKNSGVVIVVDRRGEPLVLPSAGFVPLIDA